MQKNMSYYKNYPFKLKSGTSGMVYKIFVWKILPSLPKIYPCYTICFIPRGFAKYNRFRKYFFALKLENLGKWGPFVLFGTTHLFHQQSQHSNSVMPKRCGEKSVDRKKVPNDDNVSPLKRRPIITTSWLAVKNHCHGCSARQNRIIYCYRITFSNPVGDQGWAYTGSFTGKPYLAISNRKNIDVKYPENINLSGRMPAFTLSFLVFFGTPAKRKRKFLLGDFRLKSICSELDSCTDSMLQFLHTTFHDNRQVMYHCRSIFFLLSNGVQNYASEKPKKVWNMILLILPNVSGLYTADWHEQEHFETIVTV